jgi:hypothetical protein
LPFGYSAFGAGAFEAVSPAGINNKKVQMVEVFISDSGMNHFPGQVFSSHF